MKGVTLAQLRAFVAVVQAGGLGRAAAGLHLSAPAVSMRISDLERSAGLPLFERGRALRLTPAGQDFLPCARRVLAAVGEAGDAIARLRRLEGGHVTVGLVETAEHFVPRLIARFRERHPAIEFRLRVGNRQDLAQGLRDAEIDLAIMGRPPEAQRALAQDFAPNPLGVLAAPDSPWARGPATAPSLAQAPFIVREPGSGTRAAMEEFFAVAGIAPPMAMEMASNEAIKQAVLAGLGVAFLSFHTAAGELARGELKALVLPGLPVVRRWHIVEREGAARSPAAAAFRAFVVERGGSLVSGLDLLPSRRRRGRREPARGGERRV